MSSPSLLRVTLGAFTLAAAAALRAATPAELGFDPGRLQRLDAVIQENVDQQKLAGGVMYIARDGQTVELKAFGMRDIEAKQPMTTDTIFRIASMSKAVTSVAVMILYEEGKFLLSDPVSKYLPAFKESRVAVPAPAGSPAGTKYTTVPAKRPIQIRDLLTHTAGLTYGDGLAVDDYKAARLHGWYLIDHDETIGEAVDRLATLPLHAQPGEAWQYGYSTDVLGRLVEVASGMPLDRFFAERVFAPLKMVDTCFYLPVEKESRLAKVYGVEDGKLVLTDGGHFVRGPRKLFSGGAGLVSTATDYGRLLQMLLNGGTLDGVRILSPKTVALMSENHTGTKYPNDTGAFGLGFWVMKDVGYYGEVGTVGSYGWGSAYFPQYVVDPKERMVAFMMTQLRPTGGSRLNQQVKALTYQALLK
ncbi:serine hydrolase domain-containing protein [Opitutus sp. ER46]|uniref:serine hydrolase domain-containing protein n=1 Tax=Opitutus sp. ER46 TaxID=2161864 RepID=UPI000D31467E|nr:serine hydrolase domain-containing protein [Opitutus sp. ER46]PTX99107.1 serine hydrolase [Opitutus sp. ER46]